MPGQEPTFWVGLYSMHKLQLVDGLGYDTGTEMEEKVGVGAAETYKEGVLEW
jgi:hypothetical protein